MSLSLNQKIEAILTVYPSWNAVKFMSPSRITAIYFNMLNEGRFDKRKKKAERKEPDYRQLTIFDYMEDKNKCLI